VNHVFILFFFSVKRMVVELKKFLKNCGSIGTIGFRLTMVRWYMEKTERTPLTQRISIYNYGIVFFFFGWCTRQGWTMGTVRVTTAVCSLSVIRMIYI